jgi:hypothetical protein
VARDSRGRFIKGSGKVTSVDRGADALIARMRTLAAGQNLTVGIHEAEAGQPAEGSDDGATLLDIASFNEFGGPATESKPLGNPPRRSFLQDWADENVDENRALMTKAATAVMQGRVADMPTALNRLGLLFVGQIQERIKAGIAPEQADSTAERKGSSTPLIDGGQLWQSVTHQLSTGSNQGSQ